jgi:hypothetical protein
MTNLSFETLAIILGMIVNFGGIIWGMGRIQGQVTVKLTEHQEKHIRHEARLDEHSKQLSKHSERIAYLDAITPSTRT